MNDQSVGVSVPTFSLAERDRRWELARSLLDREGLDALLVFGEHEDAGPAAFRPDTWFTNDRPGGIVLFPRTGEPAALMWLEADQAEYYGDDRQWLTPHHRRVAQHRAAEVSALLNESGLAAAVVGVAGLEPYLPFLPEGVVPHQLWSAVRAALPAVDFRLVGDSLARAMMPQGDEQLAVVRHSASIGDAMAQAMLDAAGPGVMENEVYAAGMAAAFVRGTVVPAMHLWSGQEQLGIGLPPWAYRAQQPRVLREGDVVRAEVFCQVGLHETQHQVTIAIGDVHQDFERAAVIARESYDRGLQGLLPGRSFSDVVTAMRAPLEAAGATPVFPLIHSLNPIYAIGGGRLLTKGDLVLEPGMVFAFEPHCVLDRHRVSLGGTVIVGDDGAIELNPSTARLLRA